MTLQKIATNEMERVERLIEQSVDEMQKDGGNVRFFSAAMLTAAIQLHVELEGVESLDRAITRIAMQEMQRNGITPC